MNPMQSEQLDQLAAALAAAQGEMKPAERNATNPHRGNRYADLTSVLEACRGPLSAHGLSVCQSVVTLDDGTIMLRSLLLHSSGQWVAATYPLGKLSEGMRHQDIGSGLTYGRRYTITGQVGVVADDDDDGERAGPVIAGRRPKAEPRPARRQVPRDRDDINEAFPARRNGDGHPGPTWAEFIADRADQARKHWATELAVAHVDPAVRDHPDFQMPNRHRATEHFVSHGIRTGAIRAEEVNKSDKPNVRDPAKAKAAMEDLFRKAPNKIKAAVDAYYTEVERALRVRMGMNDPAEDLEPADAGAGREPGSDDE